ncbi:rab11 family-interacting protein 3 isoform X2 [Neolamprologus brichardi]|uniref:rab11 family-interacting protein 3 isoform X2 n=1 Tax=Neolamprologus brichardi TaxID=32507 RepID=UPI0003EC2A6D|nr:rab11 family-interacting protein 3 isoform X2 [Neolamprologus brichardi]
MEPTVVSGPLGHTQWEPEQPFPLGFETLDSDNAGVPCQNKSEQTGLDFRNGDQNNISQQSQKEKDLVDNHLNVSNLSFGDLQFEGDHTTISQTFLHSTHIKDLSCTEKTEGLDEISDCTLSWLFSPNFADVIGKNSAQKQLTLKRDSPLEDLEVLSSQVALITLSVPSSPVKTDTGDPFLLVDLSNEHPAPNSESSGELNPQGVSEELVKMPCKEQADLPPLQSRETLSPEIGDKGLFPDQVTDLPVTSSATLQGLPENCLLHNTHSTPLECFEGSVPLLDLNVPDFDSSLSLWPASAASVIYTGTPLDVSSEESEVVHEEAAVIRNLSLEQQGENDLLALGLLNEPSSLTLPLVEDALIQGDLSSQSSSVENTPKDLMEDKICSEVKNQGNEAMALDPCLTVEEVHDDESWDLKPQEGVRNENSPAAEERVADATQLQGSGCDEVASFDFSVQDLNTTSSEPEWTSEQAVETISLSNMVVDDSLPMVSAVSAGEEDVSPLKAVFDALDQDGDGFVRIEEFMEFAAAYGADQVKDLTKFLDPSGLGVISFEDFHRGISAISNGGPEPQLYSVNYSPGDGAVGCQEEYDEQNEVTDSAYLGSESTYSECETFTDEDTGALVAPEMHEDVETDSGIEATLHDPEDGSNRFSLNSELHNHSLVTVIGGEEEHFEDFGESNTSELLLESTTEGPEGEGDSHLTQTPEQVNGSALRSPSAGKRLSSKKVARHLLQNSSMTLDTMSDLTRDILELADNDITDKVLLLERRVAELEKESEASGEQHARLRQENLQLVHRANAFEEQLKEQELQADEELQQETRRHKEALSKLERERGLEIENMQARLQQMDEENSELRSCVPCLRANIERLEEEKQKLQDEAEAMADRLMDETESRRKMADKLSHERHQNQKEKESTQELIEDLRKQLEHLQLYKLEAEAKRGRSPGAGLQEYQTRTREAELEQEIKRLKQDNRTLKEQNDELNGQIINLSIQGAKNLMSASFSDSLAAEINSVSRTELMEAIHKQEEINYRLQDYIDKIIVAIMESNPSILEVK